MAVLDKVQFVATAVIRFCFKIDSEFEWQGDEIVHLVANKEGADLGTQGVEALDVLLLGDAHFGGDAVADDVVIAVEGRGGRLLVQTVQQS